MKRFRILFLSTVALLPMFLASSIARADGFVIISTPPVDRVPNHFQFAPLEVTYHRVSVEINDQVATTSVDQEFFNPNPQRLEGTYMFPLPAGAHIDKFQMDINGKITDAELLDATKARTVYEDIVRRYKDPALLEYIGQDAFRARIFPIEPNSRKQIKIKYTQLLKSDTGLTEYTYPLNTEKFSSKPLNEVSVKVTLNCTDPIKALYSPSHNVEVKHDGEKKATLGWEAKNVRPDQDFKLIYSRNKSPVGVDLLTYRNSPDDGYFLLMASPGMEAPSNSKVQMRDVCFVIDTSGSMAEDGGKKMDQAKKALNFCLQNLNDGDRFEIIRFSTEAEGFFKELRPASKENIAKASEFVQGLKPIGGTAIEDALAKAINLGVTSIGPNIGIEPVRDDKRADVDPATWAKTFRAARPYMVIFLTDGQPTIGETNEDVLVDKAKKSNAAGGTRIFSFGIGNDVNTHLLDRVAADSKAFSQYVGPQEDIEVKVSTFYTKIKEPVLSGVEVTFTGDAVKPTQVYPNLMPDLYKGEMLIAFGRYTGKGPAAVKVTGTLNGERREFVQDVTFTDHDTTKPFIPQLWATRRVGWLLDEIRLHGEKPELKDEVVKLAREHGVVTPYTAFLIMEDEMKRNVPVAMQNFRELHADAAARGGAAAKYEQASAEAEDRSRRAGAGAVNSAKDLDALKQSTTLSEAAQQGQGLGKGQYAAGRSGSPSAPATEPSRDELGYKARQNYAQQSRYVNGRAFYQNGPVWTDSTAQAQAKTLKAKQIAFNGEEYFDLLKSHPDASQWLALGEQVDVVIGDTLYQVR